MTYDGYSVNSSAVPCNSEPTPFNDLEQVEMALKAGVRQMLTEDRLKAFCAEMEMLSKHSVWRMNQIEFYRCEDKQCSHSTTSKPVAKKLLAIIRENGGKMPTPQLDDVRPGHYLTLLQAIGKEPTVQVDQHLPSLNGEVPLCQRGCKIVLPSESRRKRHEIIFHFKERQAEMRRERLGHQTSRIDGQQKQFHCGFKTADGRQCQFTATSPHYLRLHKDKTGHKRQYTTR